MKISAIQRRNQIKSLIANNQSFTVAGLAEEFKVSEMTIHRDLNFLEEEGHIQRVHGGVVPTERMEFEFDFAAKRAANKEVKQLIAKEALKKVKSGQRLIIDNGTTTLELAYLIRDYENLTVITPSLAVASVLQFSEGIETILLGGTIRHRSPDLTGAVAEAVLDMFAVDIVFQGADAIDLDGAIYNVDIRMARVDQKMRKRGKYTYVLCDSSKIGKTELASNGFISEVDGLITDSNIKDNDLSVLKKINKNISVVKV
ncbi:MAG: DeoR/GlpR family DNA-binding transcription regulator [Sedimentisphaeraceae bacterium JB056]